MCKKINMNKEVEIGCPIHGAFFVTPNNHLGYNRELTAYGCPTCKDEKKIVIAEDNIRLYYEFLSDEDLEKHREVLNISFKSRNRVIEDLFCIDLLQVGFAFEVTEEFAIGQTVFGIKDTLKPIDEYIAEIKESDSYKEYVYNSSKKKEYIAYTNYASFVSFLDSDDIFLKTERCDITYWGKKWQYKTTFKSSHVINRICSDYCLGITKGNVLIKD